MRSATIIALLAVCLTAFSQIARADTPVTTPYNDGMYQGTQTTTTSTYVSGNNTVKETVVRISARGRQCNGDLANYDATVTTREFTDKTTGNVGKVTTTTNSVITPDDGPARTLDSDKVKEFDALGGYKVTTTSGKDTTIEQYDAAGTQLSGDYTTTMDGKVYHSQYDPQLHHYKPAEVVPPPVKPLKNPTSCPPPYSFLITGGPFFPSDRDLSDGKGQYAAGIVFQTNPYLNPVSVGISDEMRYFGNSVHVNTAGLQASYTANFMAHYVNEQRNSFSPVYVGAGLGFSTVSISGLQTSGLGGQVFLGFETPSGLGLQGEYHFSPQIGNIKTGGISVNLTFRPLWKKP